MHHVTIPTLVVEPADLLTAAVACIQELCDVVANAVDAGVNDARPRCEPSHCQQRRVNRRVAGIQLSSRRRPYTRTQFNC